MTGATDWREWYSRYDDAKDSLPRRLLVVRRRIREALCAPVTGSPCRILSLCAGDGRDLLPELATAGDDHREAVLVEKHEGIAADAVERARTLGVRGVTVVVGDAGVASTFASYLPVDLLLLCGIFGNISAEDVQATVRAVPGMLRQGGTVIWTRGRFEPDLRPAIRRWFVEAGIEESAWDSEPEGFGVGVGRLNREPQAAESVPERLFTFIR
jgi:hypothetical protein